MSSARLFLPLLDRVLFAAAMTCAFADATAAELGRLFYTPQQRAELETQVSIGADREGAPPNYLVVDGVIQKHGGNRIVWLNGKAQTPTRGVKNPASIEVAVPGKPKHVEVKVGQKLILREPAPESAAPAPSSTEED